LTINSSSQFHRISCLLCNISYIIYHISYIIYHISCIRRLVCRIFGWWTRDMIDGAWSLRCCWYFRYFMRKNIFDSRNYRIKSIMIISWI
jgi:hypothetical protein